MEHMVQLKIKSLECKEMPLIKKAIFFVRKSATRCFLHEKVHCTCIYPHTRSSKSINKYTGYTSYD